MFRLFKKKKTMLEKLDLKYIPKYVDVIVSLEGGFPTVLEVIDSAYDEYTYERIEDYKKAYEDVHLFSGIRFNQNIKS